MKENIKNGKFLKELRVAHNLTQKELAEKVGVEESDILVWETGIRFPEDNKTLKALAKALDVSMRNIKNGEFESSIEDYDDEHGHQIYNEKDHSIEDDEEYDYGTNEVVEETKATNRSNLLLVILSIIVFIIILIIIISLINDNKAKTYYLYFTNTELYSESSTLSYKKGEYILDFNKVLNTSSKEISNISLYYNKDDNKEVIVEGVNQYYSVVQARKVKNNVLKEMLKNTVYLDVTYSDGTTTTSRVVLTEKETSSSTYSVETVTHTAKTSNEYLIYDDSLKSTVDSNQSYVLDSSILTNYGFIYSNGKYIKNLKNMRIEYYDGYIYIYVTRDYDSLTIKKNVVDGLITYTNYGKFNTVTVEKYRIEGVRDCSNEQCSSISQYLRYSNYLANLLV